MRTNYDVALSRLLKDEGGYTNHPSDPGGPTNWGITIYDARKYWKSGATAADVKAMPLDVAKGIYRAKYWDAQRCDDLPSGVDYAVFDYGVNSGIGRSGKVLRRKLGLSDASSAVTDDVVAAAAKTDAATLVKAICDERLAFLKSLRTWPTFGVGWERRVAGVRATSLQMAGTKQPPVPAKPLTPAQKGGAAAGTVIVAGGAAAVHQGVSAMEIMGWMAGLTAAAIVLGIIGYRYFKGEWPWTSTGNQSPALSPPSPPALEKSLALASAQLALSSAGSPVVQSPQRSVSRKRQKRSGKRSPRTRKLRTNSVSSKANVVRKSSRKRKSRSRN